MAIATTCPNCKASFRLAETLAGKKVRCQKCSQVFAVPLPLAPSPLESPAPLPPTSAAPPAATLPPEPSAIAAPPMSLSLDEESVPASVVQPPAPPNHKEVAQAAVVESPPDAEVVEATVVALPGEPIIEARLAEPAAEKAPRRSGNDASPQKPRPRRAGDLPRHSSVGAGFLAAFAVLLICLGIIACFAGIVFLVKR